MDTKKCGQFLQALRKAKGLTQSQLAEMLGVSPKTVSKWECGDSIPEITILMAIAEYYGVTVDEILKGERKEAGVPVTAQTQERYARANNAYILTRRADSLKLFTIIAAALMCIGFILQLILLFTVNYTIGVVVNIGCCVAACAVFACGYVLAGGHADQYLQGEERKKLHYYSFTAVFTVAACAAADVVQAVVDGIFLSGNVNSTASDYAALSLAALAFCAVLAVYIYLSVREVNCGICAPRLYKKVCKIHVPFIAACVCVVLLLFMDVCTFVIDDGGYPAKYTVYELSGLSFFDPVNINAWLFVWIVLATAGIAAAVLVYVKKIDAGWLYLSSGGALCAFMLYARSAVYGCWRPYYADIAGAYTMNMRFGFGYYFGWGVGCALIVAAAALFIVKIYGKKGKLYSK